MMHQGQLIHAQLLTPCPIKPGLSSINKPSFPDPLDPPVDEPVGRTVVDEGVDPAEANANAVQTDDNPAVSKARR